jgi:hypothetical protein
MVASNSPYTAWKSGRAVVTIVHRDHNPEEARDVGHSANEERDEHGRDKEIGPLHADWQ